MLNINLEKYLNLSKEYNYIPILTQIMADTFTPVKVFQKIKEFSPYTFLLESVEQNTPLGRYSFIGFDPLLIFKSFGEQIEITDKDASTIKINGNPFHEIFNYLKKYHFAPIDELEKYSAGVFGYFSYDTIRNIEKIPNSNPDELKIPESLLIMPEKGIIFDNHQQTMMIICYTSAGKSENYYQTEKTLHHILQLLSNDHHEEIVQYRPVLDKKVNLKFNSNMSKDDFVKMVQRAQEYILDGDIFQVVLSQRFNIDYDYDPFLIYRMLRIINPSPYMYYLSYPDFQITGSSPEVLVKKEDHRLTLRPIAGTSPRGKTIEEDQKLEKKLLQDQKELAEHMMLVDLGRNDLGKISEFGSVQLTNFKYIENYSHVKHIVTNLESTFKKDLSLAEVLLATFPAGTLSGAPKIRAMEIIDELEPTRRGFYGGSVVHIDLNGNIDACIGIRSVVVKDKKAYIQAGGGIVADSEPEVEYQESVNKASAVMKAIEKAIEESA